MRKLIVMLLAVGILILSLAACIDDEEKDTGFEESNEERQNDTQGTLVPDNPNHDEMPPQNTEAPNESREYRLDDGVTLPQDIEKEYEVQFEKTFEIDENGNPEDYRFSWENDES